MITKIIKQGEPQLALIKTDPDNQTREDIVIFNRSEGSLLLYQPEKNILTVYNVIIFKHLLRTSRSQNLMQTVLRW